MNEFKTKEIRTLQYDRPSIEKGYANQTLRIDLSSSAISTKPVSEKMKDVFVGGKGFVSAAHHLTRGLTTSCVLGLRDDGNEASDGLCKGGRDGRGVQHELSPCALMRRVWRLSCCVDGSVPSRRRELVAVRSACAGDSSCGGVGTTDLSRKGVS